MITETGKRAKDATISDLGIKKAIVHWNLSPKELVDIAIDNQQANKLLQENSFITLRFSLYFSCAQA